MGQPVLFIEYDVDNAPSSRCGRWWTAFSGGGPVILPLVMVDSGQQISNGPVSYYGVYSAMVDASLVRPANANVQASAWRMGERAGFYIQVTNLTSVTLSAWTNSATVHAIVYEDSHVGVTDRFGRAAVEVGLSDLAPNATAAFRLETPELRDVNWDRLHFVALVDYRPTGTVGAFDTLQATAGEVLAAPFAAQPGTCTFMADPSDPAAPQRRVWLEGAPFLSWTAAVDVPWLTITPSSGSITTEPIISVIKDQLSAGWQEGNVTFTTDGGVFSDQVVIRTYFGPVKRVYLPALMQGPPE